MKILAIDTAGVTAGAAILSDKKVIGEFTINARTGSKSWTHSEVLMPGIEKLFELTRLEVDEIDYIAYTCGPGSFTGLRIGSATALGLAHALSIPSIGVPTLDAIAFNVLRNGFEGQILPLMDARRGQVYTALFQSDMLSGVKRLSDYLALDVRDALLKISDARVLLLGDGAEAYREIIAETLPNALFLPGNNNYLRTASVGLWALNELEMGVEFSSDPNRGNDLIYVRAPQAIREME